MAKTSSNTYKTPYDDTALVVLRASGPLRATASGAGPNLTCESFAGLEEPAQIVVSVASELKQECALVAAVSEIPDEAGAEVTAGAWHQGFRNR